MSRGERCWLVTLSVSPRVCSRRRNTFPPQHCIWHPPSFGGLRTVRVCARTHGFAGAAMGQASDMVGHRSTAHRPEHQRSVEPISARAWIASGPPPISALDPFAETSRWSFSRMVRSSAAGLAGESSAHGVSAVRRIGPARPLADVTGVPRRGISPDRVHAWFGKPASRSLFQSGCRRQQTSQPSSLAPEPLRRTPSSASRNRAT